MTTYRESELMVDAKVFIRWMIRRDMPEVLRIESESYVDCWAEEDFINALRCRNNIGMGIEVEDVVVGFFIYEIARTQLTVLNFAVRPDCQRRGIGTAGVNKLKSKLSKERRSKIVLQVRESNLSAQMFFRSQGFKATSLERNAYSDFYGDEDAYRFEYRFKECCGR